jgi:hypothetical protein
MIWKSRNPRNGIMLKPGPLTDEEWSFAEKLTRSIFKIQKDDVHVNYSPPKNNISRDLFY